jgi:hypothetical protein
VVAVAALVDTLAMAETVALALLQFLPRPPAVAEVAEVAQIVGEVAAAVA